MLTKLMHQQLLAFSVRAAANSVWGIAKVGWLPRVGLLADVVTHVCDRKSELQPQEVANLVWAYATLDFYAIRLFEEMADIVIGRVGGFVNQGLANVLWAYAKVGHEHEELYRVVSW